MVKIILRIAKLLAAILIAITLVLHPVAAFAHETYAYNHGDDWSKVHSGHMSGLVKDEECDGNKVTVLVWLKNDNWREFAAVGGCGANAEGWAVGSPVEMFWTCEAGECAGPGRTA